MAGTYTQLLAHVVYSTKHRQPVIKPAMREALYQHIGGIIHNKKATKLEIGGTADHLHLLIQLHQENAVADLVRDIKANSSAWIHEQFPAMRDFAWQAGYGAFTVSHSMRDVVERYVRNQEEHHRKRTFQEEFLEFLRRHEIAYDERYIWD